MGERRKGYRIEPLSQEDIRKTVKYLNESREYITRPRIREDCSNIPRPCPYITCKHSTFLDVRHKKGNDYIFYNHGILDPLEVDPEKSCVLDIVDEYDYRGTLGNKIMPNTEIGAILGISREYVRLIAVDALAKIADTCEDGKFGTVDLIDLAERGIIKEEDNYGI